MKQHIIFSNNSYDISDWKQFSEQFLVKLNEKYQEINYKSVRDRCNRELEKEIDAIFKDLSGCSARCPRCGAKCFVEGDHNDHKCEHLIPGLYGRRYHRTRKPSNEYCLSKYLYHKKYTKEDKNDVPDDDPMYDESKVTWYSNLMELISSKYPEWKHEFEAHKFMGNVNPKEELLKKAWVNTRLPLIKKFNMRNIADAWEKNYLDKDALPEDFKIDGYY